MRWTVFGALRIGMAASLIALLSIGVIGCGGPNAPEPLQEELPPLVVFLPESLSFEPFPCASAMLVEAGTGRVLYEQDADQPRAPASIAKMTLELIVMERIAEGELSLDDPIRASAWASKMGGSQVFLKDGEIFPVRDLMKSIAIASANDACVALAEHMGGSTDAFVDMMNSRVERLGCGATQYVNVHGLDDNPYRFNVTTASDISKIALEILRYPEVLEWSAMVREPFRNGTFILENTNTLIGRFAGMDGIKTGFTDRAGYCLCATAERRGMRLVSVVLGAKITSRLMTRAYNDIRLVSLATRGEPVTEQAVVVKQSQAAEIYPLATRDVRIFVPAHEAGKVRLRTQLNDPLLSPLVEGSPVGEAIIYYGDEQLGRVTLASDREIEAKGFRAWLRGAFGG